MTRNTQTGQQWVRDQNRRTTALERPTTARVGAWSLWEDEDGNLVAGRDGRAIVLARPADLSDQPTAVSDANTGYWTP